MQAFKHKTDAMRKILLLVSQGHFRYVSGIVTAKKAKALHLKFSDRYRVDATTQQRYRAKKKGQANTHLILWSENKEIYRWWILVSAGEGLVCDLETLLDATNRKTRIELTGYEVVKMPRKDNLAAWTWRMTQENFQAWQERLKASVRSKSSEAIRQAMFSLKATPGFAGSRRQAFLLLREAQGDWKRVQKGDFPHSDLFITWYGRFKKPTMIEID